MPAPEIISLGEGLIDIMPRSPGSSITATGEMKLFASGAPAIVAAALGRLGTSVGFISRVGADFFGYHIKEILEQNKVDTAGMRFDSEVNTGLAFVNWDEKGNAVYLFYRRPSADIRLHPDDIAIAYLEPARVLHFGSLLLATEPSGAATRYAIELAHRAELLLSYDVNLRLSGWPDEATARRGINLSLEFTQIVKMNRAELAFLTGVDAPEEGTRKLWRENFKLLVVTLDNEGCYYRTATATGHIAGFNKQAVDTLGAGDGFMAGLLDGLRRGNYAFDDTNLVIKACWQGCAVGALTVLRQGAISALPDRQEVDQLLQV